MPLWGKKSFDGYGKFELIDGFIPAYNSALRTASDTRLSRHLAHRASSISTASRAIRAGS